MVNVRDLLVVDYPADLVFDIMLDVMNYPTFLSSCRDVRVISNTDQVMIVDMNLSLYKFNKFYRSRVEFSKENGSIEFRSIDGNVFKNLHGIFKINPVNDYKAEFYINIDFDFDSAMLNLSASFAKNKVLKHLSRIFIDRAEELTKSTDSQSNYLP